MPPPDPDADAPLRGVRVHASLPESERRGRLATIVSFLLHALVIYLAIRLTAAVTLPDRSPIGDAIQLAVGGGGGGGKRGAAFARPTPPPPVVPPTAPPPPPPVPTVVPPPPPPEPVPPSAPAAVPPMTVAAGTGTGSGGGRGTGVGPGTGSGQGPGSGGGSGSGGGTGRGRGGVAPVPHSYVIPQLDAPKKLRGRTVEVTFQVAADGRVIDVVVAPPIEDRTYARKFDEIVRDFRFTPARDSAGRTIAGVAKMEFTF